MNEWDAVRLAVSSSVLATLLGLLVTGIRERRKRNQELHSAKRAVQAEIDSAAKHAHAYLRPGAVKGVGWRASTLIYQAMFPKLLDLSAVSHDAADALINYYQNVESFNRSMDEVAFTVPTNVGT